MISITKDQILSLAPRAKPLYIEAFTRADEVLARYGVNENPRRVAHFMAQVLHETGDLSVLTENMNYSAERLMEVWPARFPTIESARPFEHNPRALANKVYGGRMGNVGPDDGWKHIGRGPLQTTGHEAYERLGKLLGIDLVGNPDLAIDPRYSLAIAAAEWRLSGCNQLADTDDLRAVTRAVNGGYIGLDERRNCLRRTNLVWRKK
jgi:predicted chitinase